MKLTKYKHACLVLEKDGKHLVIDPGNLSTDFVVPENVVAVVITHEHPDHLDQTKLEAIVATNPEVVIAGHSDVVGGVTVAPTRTVVAGDTVDFGPFSLEFFGEKHEVIHSSYPVVTNIGVMVNNSFYYSGDSYTLPHKPVDTLALPLSGPWLKLGDAVDFLVAVHPRQAFSTHDAHLSEAGIELVDRMVPMFSKDTGIDYFRVTQPLEL